MTSLLWDQHLCLPLQPDVQVAPLNRYQRAGGALVSVNAGYSPHSLHETLALLRHYRHEVDARSAALGDDNTVQLVYTETRDGALDVIGHLYGTLATLGLQIRAKPTKPVRIMLASSRRQPWRNTRRPT
jgi:hypothetical protein